MSSQFFLVLLLISIIAALVISGLLVKRKPEKVVIRVSVIVGLFSVFFLLASVTIGLQGWDRDIPADCPDYMKDLETEQCAALAKPYYKQFSRGAREICALLFIALSSLVVAPLQRFYRQSILRFPESPLKRYLFESASGAILAIGLFLFSILWDLKPLYLILPFYLIFIIIHSALLILAFGPIPRPKALFYSLSLLEALIFISVYSLISALSIFWILNGIGRTKFS